MARRSRKPRSKPATGPTGGKGDLPEAAAPSADRLRAWLLGATTAVLVAGPLFPGESAAAAGDGLPIVMLWLLLSVFWLLGALHHGKSGLRFGPTDAAVLLLVVLHTIAAVWAAYHGSPRPAVNMLWQWIGLGAAFFLARQLIATGREARAVAAVMIALAVALAGYGGYQYFIEMPQTRAAYEKDPEGELGRAGLSYPAGSPQRELFERRLASSEPTATFALANSLAGYLATWLVVALGIGAAAGSGKRSWPTRPAVACMIVPIVACLLLTKSRSGYAATALGLALVWLWCRPGKKRIGWTRPAVLAAAVLILIAAVIAAGGLDIEVLSEAPKSLVYRVQWWQATGRMIAEHPLAGCGPGNFQCAYTAYKLPEASEEVAEPHNFLLEVWATAGTVAMLALVGVLACFAWAVWRCHLHAGMRRSDSAADSPGPTNWATRRAPLVGLLIGEIVRLFTTSSEQWGRVGANAAGAAAGGRGRGGQNLPAAAVERDAAAHVLVGGAAGSILAWPLGLMSSAPPGETALLLGLPLAVGSVFLLGGWINQGRLPGLLPAIGVIVLLVNLTAAGGIGFLGVAGTLWLLLALGLGAAETVPRGRLTKAASAVEVPTPDPSGRGSGASAPDGRPAASQTTLPRPAVMVALLVALTATTACVFTGYLPVMRCRAAIGRAQREPSRAAAHLQAAAAADPLAAEPRRHLASLALAQWRRRPTEATLRQFQQQTSAALRLSPNASSAWLLAGDGYREIYGSTHDAAHIKDALEAYSRAVQLYPNSGLRRAKLALALLDAGDAAGFEHQAGQALRLDHLTPHMDKKLPDELRGQLKQSLGNR